MSVRLNFVPLLATVRALDTSLAQRIVERLEPVVAEMVADMKANHPWTNQTGTAERELWGDAEELTDGLVWLFLSHGTEVEYGWYLETRWGGRYGIIRPTLDAWMPRIRESLRGLL